MTNFGNQMDLTSNGVDLLDDDSAMDADMFSQSLPVKSTLPSSSYQNSSPMMQPLQVNERPRSTSNVALSALKRHLSKGPSMANSPDSQPTSPTLPSSQPSPSFPSVQIQHKSLTPKFINQYIVGELLGQGSYAKVREAMDTVTLKRVAIKTIKRRLLKKIKNGEENLKLEISIMRKLKHEHVLRLIEVIKDEEKQKIYIALEFAGAGSIQNLIDTHKKLPFLDVHSYFTQIIYGLEYIHHQGIIHRDIKPANLMITSDRVLKIADFGVARELDTFAQDDMVSQSYGTPAFYSPQIASGQSHFSGFKCDIWACGITLYAMVTGTFPFTADNIMVLCDLIAKGEYNMPEGVPECIASMIRGLLDKDEEKRFSIEQIKEHPWFKNGQEASCYTNITMPAVKSLPLTDKWKSISLMKYIAPMMGTSNAQTTTSPSNNTPQAVPSAPTQIQHRKSLYERLQSVKFLPSLKTEDKDSQSSVPATPKDGSTQSDSKCTIS